MAENKFLMNAVLILIGVFVVNQMTGGAIFAQIAPAGDGDGTGTGGVDIGGLIDGTLEFTGKNFYQQGTAITAQNARVLNDGVDEGQISLNSGTVSASPKDNLKIYCFENSTAGGSDACNPSGTCYYTTPATLSYPDKERVKFACEGIQMDLTPTLTEFNDDDQPNTAQAIAASEVKTVTLKIQASADQAFGNPASTSGNALCLQYLRADFNKVKVTTKVDSSGTVTDNFATAQAISVPTNITGKVAAARDLNCYQIDKVADNGWVKYAIEMEAGSSDPSTGAIYAFVKDTDMDLNADTLAEIWGFEDEDNNVIGSHASNITIDYT